MQIQSQRADVCEEIGHPSYTRLDYQSVKNKAEKLPKNGVPPELLKVIHQIDDAQDKLQPQKAAAPVDGLQTEELAGGTFAAQRPRAVVAEGESNDQQDANAVTVAALRNLIDDAASNQKQKKAVPTIEVRTGNIMVDQFQPMYFGIAFVFCFKYCTGCPDVANTTQTEILGDRRHGADPGAPHVNIHEWAAAMMRRAETQFRREWTLGFVAWNYIFRTMVNLQKNTYVYTTYDEDGSKRPMENHEIVCAADELYRGLIATYIDIAGQRKAVNGELSKLKHVPTLSAAARTILANAEARSRNIPGTHEVRKTMRKQTHANRVCYGTSIFLTFSPSERDCTIMLRLMRGRQSDPALVTHRERVFQERDKPDIDADFCEFKLEDQACPYRSEQCNPLNLSKR